MFTAQLDKYFLKWSINQTVFVYFIKTFSSSALSYIHFPSIFHGGDFTATTTHFIFRTPAIQTPVRRSAVHGNDKKLWYSHYPDLVRTGLPSCPISVQEWSSDVYVITQFSTIVSPSTAAWSHSILCPPGHLAAAAVFNTKKKRPVVWSSLLFPVWYSSEQTTALEKCSWILCDFHTLLRRYERRNPCRSTRGFHRCALHPGILFICGFI